LLSRIAKGVQSFALLGKKGYVPLDELKGQGQHQPSHD